MFRPFFLLSVFYCCATSHLEPLASDGHKSELGWWSSWSPWTTCSRSCDGGITLSLRTCHTKSTKRRPRCIGESIRRRICNTKQCSEKHEFRGSQCSAYDSIPYRGRHYQWLPFYDPDDPCTLTCQAKGYNFVAKLSTKVQDGTRCREGALDMCVEGICKPVGCDLEIGSTLKIDECGICGGDGSGCTRAPVFVWVHQPFHPCPVSCGGGIQISEPVCLQKESEKKVDPRLCNLSLRPRIQTRPCNNFPCPVVWLPEEWGPCSATCGTGIQRRGLQCVQGGPNGTELRVHNDFCPRHKPIVERTCMVQECPRWFQGVWSPCSVSCGKGVQRRAVLCRDEKARYSEDCDQKTKPETERDCKNEILCPEEPPTTEPPPCVTDTTLPDVLPYTTEAATVPTAEFEETTTQSTSTSRSTTETLDKSDVDETATKIRASFYVGPWGPCSVPCGKGERHRLIQCQAVLEYSRKVKVVADDKCPGERPSDVEECVVWCEELSTTTAKKEEEEEEEDEDEEVEEVEGKLEEIKTTSLTPHVPEPPFVWKSSSGEYFSPCAIVCQKGDILQKELLSRVVCGVRQADGVEAQTKSTVGPCERLTTPGPIKAKQTCSDDGKKCPYAADSEPRWKVTDYNECSASCGGGWRTRTVKCMAYRKHSQAEDEELPMERCPGPQPIQRELCNVVDCPPRWKAETWSKCSKSCGGGFQTRKLRCEMRVAHPSGTILQLPPSRCLKARPKASKPCNRKPCLKSQVIPEPVFNASSAVEYESKAVKVFTGRRVTTKAFGRVSVLKGSTVKVHCPNEHGNQSTVLWFKGRRRIFSSVDAKRKSARRVTVSPKGSLRIRKVNFGDAATYTCLAGPFRSDLQLLVRPLPPGGFGKLEESTETPTTVRTTEEEPVVTESATKAEDSSFRPKVRHYPINPGHHEQMEQTVTVPDAEFTRRQQPKFLWKTGLWSQCSQTCGKEGLQIRSLECAVQLKEATTDDNNNSFRMEEMSIVNSAFCRDAGIPLPPTSKTCHMDPCPLWETGPWSSCSPTNCVSRNTAYQKREIRCKSEWQLCKEEERPRRKRECYQPKCKSLWRTGPWSQCTLACGERGMRMRRVECVWYGSGLPAGFNACKDTPQPEITSTCQGPPCSQTVSACVNHSSICEVVKKSKLCRMSYFRLQCCASCASDNEATTATSSKPK